ncbi:MAG: terpene cyclase/mutase family protein [Kiritimatiellales bacterium]|nr:terpene cyclase/mutase family protein [Kiritimatiellales bacterium]
MLRIFKGLSAPVVIITIGILAIAIFVVLDNVASKPAMNGMHSSAPIYQSVGDEVISNKDKQSLMRHAYATLESHFGRSFDAPKNIPEVEGYDRIYITLLSDNKIRCSQSGSADEDDKARTAKDVAEAVKRCIDDDRFGGKLEEGEVDDTQIVFNILFGRQRVSGTTIAELGSQIELGIHAIEVKKGSNRAYFKESVPISKNYSLSKTLERLCLKAKLEAACYKDPTIEISKFDTLAFTGDRDGNVIDLYRYNTLINAEAIDNDLLNDRIILASSWYRNNTDINGGLEYEYDPSGDKYSSANNHVRQMATSWNVGAVRNLLGDESLTPIIHATIKRYINEIKCDDGYCFVEIDGSAKLAYNAFIIMALLQAQDYPIADQWIRILAKGILAQQQPDGSYNTYFQLDLNSGVDFYPGEAMYALMQLYEATGDVRYLQSVQKAFPYYREYWRGNKNTAFVPWHSQTDLLLYKATKDPEVADFVFEMNDWLIDNHQITDGDRLDYIGGFPFGEPRNSTSSYMEGINDAYSLAKLAGDEEHIRKYGDSIRSGMRFVLLTQYTPENAFYIENQKRAIGGFRAKLTDNAQRIDYTQHAVFAIIKAMENGVFEDNN